MINLLFEGLPKIGDQFEHQPDADHWMSWCKCEEHNEAGGKHVFIWTITRIEDSIVWATCPQWKDEWCWGALLDKPE